MSGVVCWPSDDASVGDIGGKAAALRALTRAGFDVPEWFVVRASAARLGVHAIADDVMAAVQQLALHGSGHFAVRSSASEEDGTGHSFAGQFETYLDVPIADVLTRIEDVWRSGATDRVQTYRRERGFTGPPPAPAAIVQRMLVPEAAGVAFSSDPVSGRRSLAIVAAVPGLGDALVSGDADADGYEVSHEGHVRGRTLRQGATEPVLADAQATGVAALARLAAEHFGRPQDIEWAIEGGRLYLLQSRPITTLPSVPDPDGPRRIWDNSNIAESYGGITTPLTFSFARAVYAEVYRQFCLILSVPRTVVDDHRATFENMLGSIRGRVYYNLVSWYRVLALLPGFAVNRRFMEQMMGVREPMPDDVLADVATPTAWDRVRDGLRLARSLAGLLWSLVRLESRVQAFYARLDGALGTGVRLETMRLDELTAHYRSLERQLLTRWDAPLVNDFFAMIFYGVLRSLCAKWCGDADGSLQNALLSGDSGVVSAEPARRMQEMARLAAPDAALVEALTTGTAADVQRAVAAAVDGRFGSAYAAYLEKFSDRCLDELKLESATLSDDPMMLLRAVGRLAQRERTLSQGTGRAAAEPSDAGQAVASGAARVAAEAKVATALQRRPLRRAVFQWVLRHARARVRERENLRFERTRVFGRVRRIFVEAGKRLAAEGRLAQADDVFHLHVDEILGIVEGTTSVAGLGALAAARRAEYQQYRTMPAPADRFETRGAVWIGHQFQRSSASDAQSRGEERRGIGCCPGIVEGRARVILDPRDASLDPGDILVAERTDPGWILLFPAAAAVAVERGSVLSHSAIVARELGLPAVVSVAGLTSWLRDGDRIRVNGTTGVVQRLSNAAGEPDAAAPSGNTIGARGTAHHTADGPSASAEIRT